MSLHSKRAVRLRRSSAGCAPRGSQNRDAAWSLAEWERVYAYGAPTAPPCAFGRGVDGCRIDGPSPAAGTSPSGRRAARVALAHGRDGVDHRARGRDARTTPHYPRVLLKGAAYIGQDLPIAAGRLPSDLDILVPQAHLPDAQARLTQAGWNTVELDDHDQRYYYEWSHEVPPMTHPLLGMELDLHHNILPPVARTHVDADALLERLRPSKWSSWQVLDPLDQVLHSAAHLFHDSEARDRIRDVVDLDGLLRHFGADPGFISRLPDRAQALGLQEPLALACHFCVNWFGTPIPADVLEHIESIGPGRFRRAWLLPLLSTSLMPTEPDDIPPLRQDIAATVLLARYHRQRMPLRLLVPHLWHKVRVGRSTDRAKASDAAPV